MKHSYHRQLHTRILKIGLRLFLNYRINVIMETWYGKGEWLKVQKVEFKLMGGVYNCGRILFMLDLPTIYISIKLY